MPAGAGANRNGSVFGLNGLLFENGGRESGFVGGGQIGYNMQFGSFVLGAEADLQYADLGGKGRYIQRAGAWYNIGNGGGLDYFGTVRARLGLAIDRALVYGTGGFAYGGGDNKNGCYAGTLVSCGNDDNSTG